MADPICIKKILIHCINSHAKQLKLFPLKFNAKWKQKKNSIFVPFMGFSFKNDQKKTTPQLKLKNNHNCCVCCKWRVFFS